MLTPEEILEANLEKAKKELEDFKKLNKSTDFYYRKMVEYELERCQLNEKIATLMRWGRFRKKYFENKTS